MSSSLTTMPPSTRREEMEMLESFSMASRTSDRNHPRTYDGYVQDVGLKLHEQFVDDHATVYAQGGDGNVGILLHGVQDFRSESSADVRRVRPGCRTETA